MVDSIWKKSANPETRKKEYDAHQKRNAESEMRKPNVVKRNVVDQLRGKYGKKQ